MANQRRFNTSHKRSCDGTTGCYELVPHEAGLLANFRFSKAKITNRADKANDIVIELTSAARPK